MNFVWRRRLAAAFMMISAVAIVAGTFVLRQAWPPANEKFSPFLPFMFPTLPHASSWWWYFIGWESLWMLGCVVFVFTLLTVPEDTRKHGVPDFRKIALGILLLQVALLGISLNARIPFNSDQYLYLGYADLVREGYNPYDPPRATQPVSPQMRDISTVWRIAEGAPDARQRIIVRDRYGPVWTLAISWITAPFSNLDVWGQSVALRCFSAVLMIACGVLLRLALADFPWGGAALASFSLNPLVILQTSVGAHNDIFALFFALLAYLAARKGHFARAGLAAACAAGTKMSFAPYVLPLAAYAYFVARWSGLARVALATGGLLLLSALPFGGLRALLQPVGDLHAYNESLLTYSAERLARHFPGLHWVHDGSFAGVYYVVVVGVTSALAWMVITGVRTKRWEAGLALLIFSGAQFEPWYAISLTALLLMPTPWSIPLFLGTTYAACFREYKMFAETKNMLDFGAFVLVAVVAVGVLAWLLRRSRCMSDPGHEPH